MLKVKSLLVALGLALAATMAAPSPASAESASPVVILDYERLLAQSVGGHDIETKLRQIATQMQGEVQAEQTAVQQEAQSLQTATQGKTPEQIQRDSALSTRIQRFNERAEALRAQQITRQRDLEYTRQQALAELNRQLQPIVTEVMNARRASIVIDRGAVQMASENVDVTADVISRMDQRLRTVNVTRQSAPAPQQQGASAPAGGGH
ncbi:MAG: OmpH family outer membrane protein [Hyphomonadaceae bacterium]